MLSRLHVWRVNFEEPEAQIETAGTNFHTKMTFAPSARFFWFGEKRNFVWFGANIRTLTNWKGQSICFYVYIKTSPLSKTNSLHNSKQKNAHFCKDRDAEVCSEYEIGFLRHRAGHPKSLSRAFFMAQGNEFMVSFFVWMWRSFYGRKKLFHQETFFQCVDSEALLWGQLTQGIFKENKDWNFYVTMPCIAEVLGAFKSVDLFLVVPDEELTLPWENLQSFGYFTPDSFLWK